MTATLASGISAFALDLTYMLVAAGALAALFRRANLESIPGFLIAGVILGPHMLGLVQDGERVEQISDLAVILLMFGIGLHLDLDSIRRGMVHILAIGVISTVAVVVLSWVGLMFVGVRAPVALLISMGAAISSTAVFVRVVTQRKELQTIHGRVGIGISIAQDILTVAMLALIPPLARWSGGPGAGGGEDPWAIGLPLWLALPVLGAKGLGGVTLMVLTGRFVLPRLLTAVTKLASGELLLVTSMAVALAAAVGTKMLGFSGEMGAFLGGLLLASTPFRFQLSGLIGPLRDLLMAVFFTTVGLKVDPAVLVSNKWLVIGGVFSTVAMKGVVIAITSWLAGVNASSAILTGAYLANAGEFTIVIAGAAVAAGGLSQDEAGMLVCVVILSVIVCSLIVKPAHIWADRASKLPMSKLAKPGTFGSEEGVVRERLKGHVIIAGFGPVGRALADRFAVLEIPTVVVELNPKTVMKHTALGRRFVYGDITNTEVLENSGVHDASAVILTIPDDEAVFRACGAVRKLAPDAFIAARTGYLSGAFRAQSMGADHVTVEEVATAQAMEREVLAKISSRLSEARP